MSDESEMPGDAPPGGRRFAPRFTRGGVPGPGRPKGSRNRTTSAMREAFMAVFEDLQASHKGEGRFPHLRAWADAHPTEYYKIAVRLMPLEVEARSAIGMVVFKGIND